jgi:signal transduction histidine kinase
MREAYEIGAVDFLVKPFHPDILRWKVSVFVELYKSRQRELLLIDAQNARAEVEAAERRARFLANLNITLASNIDQHVILDRLVKGLVPEFADHSLIFTRDQADACDSGDPVFEALTREKPVTADNLERDAYSRLAPAHRDFVQPLHLKSGVFFRVHSPSGMIAVLGLYRRAKGGFSTAELLFVDELSARIALVMANVELYQKSQEANRVKDEFLAIVSHELRTPLVSILGWAHILSSRQMPPEAVEKALRTIQRNAKLQNDLIGDILDFSRISTGRFSINFEKADVKSILEESIEAMRPLAEAKGIQLVTDIPDKVPTIPGDPTRLNQLFSNILSNAIKFTPEKGRVTIQLESTRQRAQIRVTDTGIGIEPEFLPQMFKPFVQADGSNTRSYAGLGLGLAIVRHIVNLHHGDIRAESAGRGQGTTITVTLPLGFVESLAS